MSGRLRRWRNCQPPDCGSAIPSTKSFRGGAGAGRTSVEVGERGFGGTTIGGIGARVMEEQAHATLDAAWDAGLRYFDTAPRYGRGVSELRAGRLLREKPRAEFVTSTKVGRILPAPTDTAASMAVRGTAEDPSKSICDRYGVPHAIPVELWQELKTAGLVHADALTPTGHTASAAARQENG